MTKVFSLAASLSLVAGVAIAADGRILPQPFVPESGIEPLLLMEFREISEAANESTGGSQPQAAVPPVLAGRSAVIQTEDPLWVSAQAATTEEGEVDWVLLGDRAKSIFEGVADQPPIPLSILSKMPEMSGVVYEIGAQGKRRTWIRYGPGSIDESRDPVRTLEELAGRAGGAYVGEVVALSEGFFFGEVGSLLRVRTERALLPSAEHQIAEEFYLYWPQAKFSIGSLNFWKESPAYPSRPEIGSRILVVADQRVAFDRHQEVLLPRPEGVFVESPKGKLRLSPKAAEVRGSEPSSLKEVLEKLEQILGEGGEF